MATHSYGWHPSKPDFRDMPFAAARSTLATLPVTVDLSRPSLGAPFDPPWDQGAIGSCGPHSSCSDIVFAALRQQKLAVAPMPSRLFVYYTSRALMGTVNSDSGVDNRTMLKALAQYGWCDESLWPYDVSKFKLKPPAAAFSQASGRRITAYLAVPQNLDQMKACLAAGDPFIYGFTVYSSMETPAVEGTGIVPMPTRRDAVLGGHDVQIVGYSDVDVEHWPARHFRFKNSWDGWGDAGYGYMPYEYATNPQLSGDFWTIRHSALPDVPNPPVPPGPPDPNPPAAPYIDVPRAGRYVLQVT